MYADEEKAPTGLHFAVRALINERRAERAAGVGDAEHRGGARSAAEAPPQAAP